MVLVRLLAKLGLPSELQTLTLALPFINARTMFQSVLCCSVFTRAM